MNDIIAMLVQLAASVAGSFGYALMYNTRGVKLLVSAFGGFVSWGSFLFFRMIIENEILCYFLVALLIAIYSEIFARIKKTPSTTFLVPSIISLIPGGVLYYTMGYVFESDLSQFYSYAAYTIELAFALAAGIVVIATAVRVIKAVGCAIKHRLKKGNSASIQN